MDRARRVPCVGAVVHDGAGRLLLVRRAHPPAAGTWSLPGGRVEPGESHSAALRREVREETALSVRVGAVAGRVERAGPEGVTYDIVDHLCTLVGGDLRAGDDASAAGWFTPDEVARLDTAPGLVRALQQWGVLGR